MHPSSPNARAMWSSFLPAIVAKCIWFAWDAFNVQVNFRSLVLGLTVYGMPGVWVLHH